MSRNSKTNRCHEILDWFEHHGRGLNQLIVLLLEDDSDDLLHSRPFLIEVLASSERIVEMLDACQARTNKVWYIVRGRLSALRDGALAAHELLHLKSAIPRYDVGADTGGELTRETQRATDFFARALRFLILRIIRDWKAIGVKLPEKNERSKAEFVEEVPCVFPHNRPSKPGGEKAILHIKSLAINYLAAASEARFLSKYRRGRKAWQTVIPEPFCENSLRLLWTKFRNLQTEYNTYVGNEQTKIFLEDINILRDHVAAICHLSRAAHILLRFFEWNLETEEYFEFSSDNGLVSPEDFSWVMFDYLLRHSYHLAENGRSIAQNIIHHYAEEVEATIPVPPYCGFHVRPSTMMEAIVNHYGQQGNVKLILGSSEYDLERNALIFRANEAIKRDKRELLVKELRTLCEGRPCPGKKQGRKEITAIIAELIGREKITVLEKNWAQAFSVVESESLFSCCYNVIEELQNLGCIDLPTKLMVTVRGDKQVVDDLRILAEHGYCETRDGKDLGIPAALSYLRHGRQKLDRSKAR